ncbi:PUA-like domain-containing protein [Rhizobium sp. N541]|uniref:EVE domain-containing protein n=1 Tax=unclassified Rhizobium TaxID=2613769 RepID=UPI0007EE33CF|nr:MULTISPECIES: EVE domain-containing protein [unclassified Rhizobium]ANM18244.1 PUA-like domain-containing protein [Rhizobium sp. N541]ANM24630.1 PUA-like domain-containing protein [Rhizobium sp. N941]
MDEQITRLIGKIADFEKLATFEKNARRQGRLNAEIQAAIKVRAGELGRTLISQRTQLNLSELTPAEEGIVQAVAEYVGIKKHQGRNASRTFSQLKNRGLIGAAEEAVSHAKTTAGFQTLADQNLSELSYEQIIVDHPTEFSPRALWYARRTLGLKNDSGTPPAKSVTAVQSRTTVLLDWLRARSQQYEQGLGAFTNEDAAAVLGIPDLTRYGRVYGNIQSRVDFACYQLALPPLGLTALTPFKEAWQPQDRTWVFPISTMQQAAREFQWQTHDFDNISHIVGGLPGQAHVVWKQELAEHEEAVREWAEGLGAGRRKSAPPISTVAPVRKGRNPNWTREEHILGLDLFLRLRGTTYPDEHPDVIALSRTLLALARFRGMSGDASFRNPNGVSMKMQNFLRLDETYTRSGRVGLPGGSDLEKVVWEEFASDPAKLHRAIQEIMEEFEAARAREAEGRYWVFVCNPKKWAIDKFLASETEVDQWGVRPSDRDFFAPGQLGIVRVGVDKRSTAERKGSEPLQAGIYALCAVESEAFDGTGARDEYWAEGEAREPGWPTVRLRYLRNYSSKPLTIERLRTELPMLSPLVLDGFQASSFPIATGDFQAIMSLIEEDFDEVSIAPHATADTPEDVETLEKRYMFASPEVRRRVSKFIERGPVGAAVKKANEYKCQLCEALGHNPLSFLKKNGTPYVEAHHVMPVSTRRVGVLSASNVMTLCANHHREMHYGNIIVNIQDSVFEVCLTEKTFSIRRLALHSVKSSL